MHGNNRNLPGGGKPTAERKREYASGYAVGTVLIGIHEDAQRKQAKKEKGTVPNKHLETWPYPTRKDGTRRSGDREVELCRLKGRFASLSQARAAHFGMKTGSDIPPPARRKS